jgi:alpha-beta hydrolase superfamily lysophospholipase
VLAIHGGSDTIMSRADTSAIAEIVNKAHPGRARFVEIPGMTHDFTVNMKFQANLVALISDWMKEVLAH